MGSEHADRMIGSELGNRLIGLGGADAIAAGAGKDSVFGGKGSDALEGGADDDRVEYTDAPGGVEVDLRTQTALSPDGNEKFASMEAVMGSNHDDTIIGTDAANWYLYGGPGVDAILGLGGDDVIMGGQDGDALSGGAGNDLVYADDDRFGTDRGSDVAHGGSGSTPCRTAWSWLLA